jgi:putative ABC transport system permease protein
MTRLRILWARLAALLGRRAADQDMHDEIAGHLAEAREEFERRGLDPAAARREALRQFGGVTQTEQAHREGRAFVSLDRWRTDSRLSARALRRQPAFTLAVVAVLALGTGAIVAVFALLNAVVLQPLPFPRSDRLVVIEHQIFRAKITRVGVSVSLEQFYARHAQAFESVHLYSESILNLRQPDGSLSPVHVTLADHTLFESLAVRPALGRLFTADDTRPGFSDISWPVPILLAHRLWAERLGADPNIIGRTVTINDLRRVVVGVLPRDFHFPDTATDVWILNEPRTVRNFGGAFGAQALAVLRPGVTAAAAQAELASLLPQLSATYPDASPARLAALRLVPIVTPLKAAIIGDVAPILWTLFGGMTCLLLAAGANAGGLLVVRVEHRRREIAVREALGASRRDIAHLFFVEALLIAMTAAAAGLLGAKGLLVLVMTLTPIELPRASEIAIGGVAVAFALGLAALTAVLYGALAVRRQRQGSGQSPLSALGGNRAATAPHAQTRWRDGFIALQVAVALSLIVGSALMVQTYRNLERRDLGFVPAGVLTIEIGLPYAEADRYVQIYSAVVAQLRALPGVESTAAADFAPLTEAAYLFPVQPGTPPIPFKFVTPDYLATMKTPLLDRTRLTTGAHFEVDRPVFVSEALARRLYPGQSAIGQPIERLNQDGSRVEMGHGPILPFTIAGVVGDTLETSLRAGPAEIVYIPVSDPAVEPEIVPTNMTLLIRARLPPMTLATAARAAIVAVDPRLSVGRVRTMDSIVTAARGREAFVGVLLVLAAAASLLLGAVGIYAAVAQVVRNRQKEIGIRLALGARPAAVIRLVTAGAIRAVGVGATVGLVLALAAAGALHSLVFGVTPHDPTVLAGVLVLVLVSGGAAALLAAIRASKVGATDALRAE